MLDGICQHSGSRRFATGCEPTVLAILLSQLLDLRIGQTRGGLHSQGRQDLVYRSCEGVLHLSRCGETGVSAKGGNVKVGGSPSSGSFLAQGTAAGTGVGGYAISVCSKTLEKGSPAFQEENTGAAVEKQKEWMSSCSRLQKGRNYRTAGEVELKPTDLGIDPSTCQERDKCRQAVLRCTA